MTRILALAIILILSPVLAHGQKLVSEISARSVEISSGFDGEKISIYGVLAPEGLNAETQAGRLDVVVAVVGPTQPCVTPLKTRNCGLWLNTEQVEYPEIPGFFRVLSSARLGDVAERDLLIDNEIVPEALGSIDALGSGEQASQIYNRDGPDPVRRRSPWADRLWGAILVGRAFSAQVQLLSDAPPGAYIVRIFAFRDGQIIDRNSKGFNVRKVVLEPYVDQSARHSPLR